MVHGDLTDRDGVGKLGHLVLARSLRAWDTRFQPDPLSYLFKRVFPGHPTGEYNGVWAGVFQLLLHSAETSNAISQ